MPILGSFELSFVHEKGYRHIIVSDYRQCAVDISTMLNKINNKTCTASCIYLYIYMCV